MAYHFSFANFSNLPDTQMSAQGGDLLVGDLLKQRSGIYVDTRQFNYGTRYLSKQNSYLQHYIKISYLHVCPGIYLNRPPTYSY